MCTGLKIKGLSTVIVRYFYFCDLSSVCWKGPGNKWNVHTHTYYSCRYLSFILLLCKHNREVLFPSHKFGLRAYFPLASKHSSSSFALLLNGCRRLGQSVSPILHSIFNSVAMSTGPYRYSYNYIPSFRISYIDGRSLHPTSPRNSWYA